MALLVRIGLRVPMNAWCSVGFPAGTWRLGDTCVSVDDCSGPSVLMAEIAECGDDIAVAGMERSSGQVTCTSAMNGLDLEAIDHLMVRTREAETTLQSLSSSFRVAVAVDGNGERSVWLNSVRIDMVPTPELTAPAELWGIAFRVKNIDTVVDQLGGDVIGVPKPARQPGQRVAVFRGGAGLGLPIALIDFRG